MSESNTVRKLNDAVSILALGIAINMLFYSAVCAGMVWMIVLAVESL